MARRRRARGSGSVYFDKIAGSWMARISLGTRDGRRVGKKVRAPSEPAARAELERLRRAYLGDVDVSTQTLDEYLADWLAAHGPSVRESTRVSYTGHIDKHISPLLGGILVSRLRPADVRRLIADRSRVVSPSTVHRIHATLYMALEQGVRDRTLSDNAAKGISLPRVEHAPVEAMSEATAERIIDATRDTFLGPLVELLLGSGIRLGEALGLDQGDLHIEERFVVVRVTKTRVRAVPISDDACDALRRALTAAKRRGPKEPVFYGPRTGQRMTTATVSHAFPKILQAAGLPRLTPHGLRHGAASRLVAAGVHMRLVAEQLGHSNPSLTARTYAHVLPEAQKEAVRLLNRRSGAR